MDHPHTPVILLEADGSFETVEPGEPLRKGDALTANGKKWTVVADAPNSHSQFAPVAVRRRKARSVQAGQFAPPPRFTEGRNLAEG